MEEFDDSILNQKEIEDPTTVPAPQHEPPRFFYTPQQPPVVAPVAKKDIFGDLDRMAVFLIFIAFILGFFMGKTMQPVILKQG